jgi:hypothetical protein
MDVHHGDAQVCGIVCIGVLVVHVIPKSHH